MFLAVLRTEENPNQRIKPLSMSSKFQNTSHRISRYGESKTRSTEKTENKESIF